MAVMLADEQLDRLAGIAQRGGEIARLALELGGLVGAVGDDDRRAEAARDGAAG